MLTGPGGHQESTTFDLVHLGRFKGFCLFLVSLLSVYLFVSLLVFSSYSVCSVSGSSVHLNARTGNLRE